MHTVFRRLAIFTQFRYLSKEELPPDVLGGVRFTTVTIDIPVYLNYLLARFLSHPHGKIVRATVQHVDQIILGSFCLPPDALVICAGLGARTLGGVEDKTVYPIRGQTVLIHAPWITYGRTLSSLKGDWTYIIPRRSGDVRPDLFLKRIVFACIVQLDLILSIFVGHSRWY